MFITYLHGKQHNVYLRYVRVNQNVYLRYDIMVRNVRNVRGVYNIQYIYIDAEI